MISKIIGKIKDEEKKNIKNLGKVWGISKFWTSLEDFLSYFKEYFHLDIETESYKFDNIFDYLRQEDDKLNYIRYFLDQIKPFLLLSFKLSMDPYIPEAIKEKRINEDSIIKMVRNFVRLNRTGRKRIFYDFEKQKFSEFKKSFSNIIKFHKEITSWQKDKKKGSIIDYANAIKTFQITKEALQDYLSKIRFWIRDCNRSTKYRFDKDILLIEDSKISIELILKDYDFFIKCLKDHEKYQQEHIKENIS